MANLDHLKLTLDDLLKQHDIASSKFAYSASVEVIRHFLGNDWYEVNLLPRQRHKKIEPWFQPETDAPEIRNSRTALLAASLFDLKDADGFSHLVERFRERQDKPRACSAEAIVAARFARRPRTIVQIRREVGEKGSDFDFSVWFDHREISIEVTSRTTAKIASDSFTSTLKHKHAQLPDNKPAIIFVHLNQDQMDNKTSLAAIEESTQAFFKSNRRVNFVVIFSDFVMLTPGTRFITAYRWHTIRHRAPRHFLLETVLKNPFQPRVNWLPDAVSADPENAMAYLSERLPEPYSHLIWYKKGLD